MGTTYLDNRVITFDLIVRSEGVHVAELGHGKRNHAACAVELHGAASESNHTMHEANVLGCEVIDITQHLSFRVMLVEDRMRQTFRCTLKLRWDCRRRGLFKALKTDGICRGGRSEDIDKVQQVLGCDALIECNTNMLVIHTAKVDANLGSFLENDLCTSYSSGHVESDGIEISVIDGLVAERFYCRSEDLSESVNSVCDGA